MTEEEQRLTAFGRARRRLLRFAGIAVVAAGAGSILSYGDSSTKRRSSPFETLPAAIGKPGPNTRVVYSTHTPETVVAVLKRYLRAYPEQRVQLIHLSSTDAARRLTAERNDPVADVWIHAHAVELADVVAQGALRAHRSDLGAQLPERYRDEQGRWYAVGLRPQVLAYNRRVLEQAKLQPPPSMLGLSERTWRANTLGTWTGAAVIGLPDPVQPSTLTWLASLFLALGREEAEKFVNNVFTQGAGIPGGTADLLGAIQNESYALGPVEGPQVIRMIQQGATELSFAYVEQDARGALPGAWMSPTAIALTKDSQEAHRLMDFLLSTEAANSFVQEGFEFPVRADIPIPETHNAPRGGLRAAPQSVRDIGTGIEDARQALRAWIG